MTVLEDEIVRSMRLQNSTKRDYLAAVREYIAFAGHNSAYWTLDSVERWRDSMLKRLDRGTVRRMLYALRYAAGRVAVRQGLRADATFVHGAEVPALRKSRNEKLSRQRALTVDDARRIIHTCDTTKPPGYRDYVMLILGFRTGARPFSFVRNTFGGKGLCVEDIDTTTWRMTITLKGGTRHELPRLDDECRSVLGGYLTWLKNSGVKSGPVFRHFARADLKGKVKLQDGLTTSGHSVVLREAAERAGIPDFTPYTMRYTFMTWCEELGMADWEIAAYTGHARVQAPVIRRYQDIQKLMEAKMPLNKIPKLG